VEASVEKAIALHPNRHALHVHVCRAPRGHIYKDDEINMDYDNENKMVRTIDSEEVYVSACWFIAYLFCSSNIIFSRIMSLGDLSLLPSHLFAGVHGHGER
jgi:hypothetical protein